MSEIADILCSFSDGQLDAKMHPLIRKWDEEPKAIQILEVLDHVIHGSLASGFVVSSLQVLYDIACEAEKTSHEEVVQKATWRNR